MVTKSGSNIPSCNPELSSREQWNSKLLSLSESSERLAQGPPTAEANRQRRMFYRELDALRIEMETLMEKEGVTSERESPTAGSAPMSNMLKSMVSCKQIMEKTNKWLTIQRVPSAAEDGPVRDTFMQLDALNRLICVSLLFIFLSLVVALPLVILAASETTLLRARAGGQALKPSKRPSVMVKIAVARWILAVLGVHVVCEGQQYAEEAGAEKPALVMLAHASNLDPIIIMSTYPWGLGCVMKSSLLKVPYLSWMALALGGVPIDRSNRSSAVASMTAAGQMCLRAGNSLAISPEGTRSTTGHLLPFKKGAFHLVQELRWPMLPVSIHGAFELWGPKQALVRRGTVIVRYHSPLIMQPLNGENHASDEREELRERLRTVLLDALEHTPPPPQPTKENVLKDELYGLVVLLGTYWVMASSAHALIGAAGGREMAPIQALAWWLGYTAVVTAVLNSITARHIARCARTSDSP